MNVATQTKSEVRDPKHAARVLVVDDEEGVRVALCRSLAAGGHEVSLASSYAEAKQLLEAQSFDVVLSDVHMPSGSGIDLLRFVREKDSELPVILLTGIPTTETAVGAVELRATGYLTKPLEPERLLAEIGRVLTMRELAIVRKHAHELTNKEAQDRAQASAAFERALQALFMVFHPVVDWPAKSVFGYEALMRCKEQGFGNPMVLLEAADKLGRLHDLGRRVRGLCAEALAAQSDQDCLFVNLHPVELDDDDLYSPDAPLTKLAHRVVLEITERAKLETVPEVESRIAKLRAAGFRVAIDDIGAGYSGLNSFTLLKPDFVKIDMALVRGIHTDPVKRRLTGLLVQLCQDLEIGVVAEGVETADERDALLSLGCKLLQGYLFAKPATPPPVPTLS